MKRNTAHKEKKVVKRVYFVIISFFILSVFTLLFPNEGIAWEKIGDKTDVTFQTDHPYAPDFIQGTHLIWEKTISYPEATYMAVHFKKFDLSGSDFIEITDPLEYYHHRYSKNGYMNKGGDFWGLSVTGNTIIVRLYARGNTHRGYGFLIDAFAHGFPHNEIPQSKAVCGTEDFKDAICYENTYPQEYEKSKAVVKLLKDGVSHCTGWLVSCENHLLTNEHCVSSQSELDHIEFQFMYQRPQCDSGTAVYELQLQGGTFLRDNNNLDYCLLQPNLAGNDPQNIYGYIQIDNRLPDIDELMYIPGHPSGDPKRLSIESTDAHDQSGRCEVYSIDETPCAGGPGDIGYYCDTEGGSSGSPVLSAITNKAIALHHCANCPNRGVPITAVYADIQASGTPLPPCSTCEAGNTTKQLSAFANTPNVVTLNWTVVQGAVIYHIYRSRTSCDTTIKSFSEIGTTSFASYQDKNVSGGFTYYYRIRVENECGTQSVYSQCATIAATGNCIEKPIFTGAVSAASETQNICTVDVLWNPATTECGDSIVYHVYSSTNPDFVPDQSNLIASCVSGNTYQHVGAQPGMNYYIVRAENNSPYGSGSCFGGMVDDNSKIVQVSAHGVAIPGDYFDDMESPEPNYWTHSAAIGTDDWAYSTIKSYSPTHSWFSSDVSSVKDDMLMMPEKHLGTASTLQFYHYYYMESSYDGCVIEISTDGGSTFSDLEPFITEGDYNGTINSSSSSPIAGRQAWTGSSGSFILTSVDLAAYANQDVIIRFRLACDGSVSSTGWYIDDVTLADTFIFNSCSAALPVLSSIGFIILLLLITIFILKSFHYNKRAIKL